MSTISLLSTFEPIGGIGTNPINPSLDPVPNSPETALTPANYAPGTTNGLIAGPNPRTISNDVDGATNDPTANADTNDPTYSAWLYVFGQFVDHDLDLQSVGTTDISIPVPNGDPDFPDGTTIPVTRAVTDPTTGTALNTVTGVLDLSQIYGSDPTTAASLRNPDGTLKTSDGDALPIVNGAFVSGDTRVDENPELTVISTMFVREHNYWVGVLAAQNPTWTGNQLYDMAKAITTAEYQNIIYTEYLPALLGLNAVGSYSGFNPKVSTQITQEFSTAAFRVGHSQVSDEQAQIDNNGNVTYSQSLTDSFANTPLQTEANDGINSLLRDLSSDYSQAVDVYAVSGLRNLLSDSPDQMDLIAIDIQRERDLGLGMLNDTRTALGLPPYTSFAQLTSDRTVAANLQATFGNINNVDLFVGGLAENHAPGADVGSTFQAIIADQFTALRAGDFYFWQNEHFDPATRQMISQTTLGDIIERDTGTPAEQQNVFVAATRVASDAVPTNPTGPELVIGVNTPGATITGSPYDDTIVAGLGLNQILSGGGGANVFQYNGSGHTDSITGFNPAVDKIQFQSATNTNTSTLLSDVFQNATAAVDVRDFGGNAVVQFDGNTITLDGVRAASVTAADFLFPPGSTTGVITPRTS
jgi:peroxidase